MLLPEELPLGPLALILPRLLEGVHDARAVDREPELVLLSAELGRQIVEAAEQVIRGKEGEPVQVVVPLHVAVPLVRKRLFHRLARVGELVLEEAGASADGWGGLRRAVVPAEELHEVRMLLLLGDDLLGRLARLDAARHPVLLHLGVVEVHEPGDVSQVLVGSVLLLDEPLQYAEVPAQAGRAGDREQVTDVGGTALAEAVDAAVPLLEGDEGPRQVEVDHAMALVVEVDPLGGGVGRE